MKVSREQMAENRVRILDEAGRLFREKGFDAVTVSDVMRAAGMTHGGFYGHFSSKDDLIAQTLAHGLSRVGPPPASWSDYLGRYLAPGSCTRTGGGCAISDLASETARQTPEARAAMTEGIRTHISRLSAIQPGGDASAQRRAAIGGWAAMVGATILSRACDDDALAGEILAETRAWIEAQCTADSPMGPALADSIGQKP